MLSIQSPNTTNATTTDHGTLDDELLQAVSKYKQSTDELFNQLGQNAHLYLHLLNQSPRTPIVYPEQQKTQKNQWKQKQEEIPLPYSYMATLHNNHDGIKFISMYGPSPVMTNEVRGLVQLAYNDSELLHKLSTIYERVHGTYSTITFIQNALLHPH
jgi:hypothetical protein